MAGDSQSKLSTGAAAECSQWGSTNQSQTMIFPTKLSAINHQGGSLLAANTGQAAPSWDTVQLSSPTRAYSYSIQSSQDSSTTHIVRSPKILDAESSICILPNTRQNIFDLTKKSKKRAMSPCMKVCSIGMPQWIFSPGWPH